ARPGVSAPRNEARPGRRGRARPVRASYQSGVYAGTPAGPWFVFGESRAKAMRGCAGPRTFRAASAATGRSAGLSSAMLGRVVLGGAAPGRPRMACLLQALAQRIHEIDDGRLFLRVLGGY